MHKQAGITLIEAATALAIVAILATTALPPVRELIKQYRADTTISALRADVMLARTAAIMNGRATVMCLQSSSGGCASELAWQTGWLVRPADAADSEATDTIRTATLPEGIALRSNRRTLRYRSDGSAAGSNQTIRVCVDGRQRAALIINNGGRPRSQRTVPHVPC